jgi:hypothetical protein
MTDHVETIREYHDATLDAKIAMAETIAAHPEWESLPVDVRTAKACLECRDALARQHRAVSAYEQMKADREERWIAAHEYSTAWRREGTAT